MQMNAAADVQHVHGAGKSASAETESRQNSSQPVFSLFVGQDCYACLDDNMKDGQSALHPASTDLEEGVGGAALLQVGSKVPVADRLFHFDQQGPKLLKLSRLQGLEPHLLLSNKCYLRNQPSAHEGCQAAIVK